MRDVACTDDCVYVRFIELSDNGDSPLGESRDLRHRRSVNDRFFRKV